MTGTRCKCGKQCKSVTELLLHLNFYKNKPGHGPYKSADRPKKRPRSSRATDPSPASPKQQVAPLPPQLGGRGPRNQSDYLFVADAGDVNSNEGSPDAMDVDAETPSINDDVGEGTSGHDRSTTTDDPASGDEDGEFDPAVFDYNDATGEEFLEAFKILNFQIRRGDGHAHDQLIKLISCEKWGSFDMGKLIRDSKLTSAKEIVREMQTNVDEEMARLKFEKVKVRNPYNEKEYVEMWSRDAAEVLKDQMRRAVLRGKGKNFYRKPFKGKNRKGEKCFSHPMSSETVHRSYPEIVADLKVSNTPGANWVDEKDVKELEDGVQSMIAYVQGYSDVSNEGRGANSHAFYPVHLSILNFATGFKDRMVVDGDAVIAYFPTDSKWRSETVTKYDVHGDYDGFGGQTGEMEYTEATGLRTDHTEKSKGQPKPVSTEEAKPEPFKKVKKEDKPKDAIFGACYNRATDSIKSAGDRPHLVYDSHGVPWKVHYPLASYVADHPETCKIAGVKEGYCHICTVELNDRNKIPVKGERPTRRNPAEGREWNLQRIRGRLERKYAMRQEANKKIDNSNLHRFLSPLSDWPFAEYPGLGFYEIFHYEHMHCNLIGNFKHEADIVIQRLDDEKTKTNNGSKLNQENWTYEQHLLDGNLSTLRAKKRVVTGALNVYMSNIQTEAPCVGAKFDHTRKNLTSDLDGFFREDNIATMLQATHYKDIMQISPFVGALCDKLSGNIPKTGVCDIDPLITTLFVSFAELNAAITKKDRVDRSFSDADLENLSEKIKAHNDHLQHPDIKKYQKSEFNYAKRHVENCHCRESIESLGPVFNYDAAVWETSHLGWKFNYRKGSKRHSCAMEETLKSMAVSQAALRHLQKLYRSGVRGALVYYLVTGRRAPKAEIPYNKKKAEVALADEPAMITKGKEFQASSLQDILINVSKGEENMRSFVSGKGMEKIFLGCKSGSSSYNANAFIHQCGGPNFLVKPVWDIIRSRATSHLGRVSSNGLASEKVQMAEAVARVVNGTKMKMVTSCYIPGIDAPTMENLSSQAGDNFGTITVEDNGERHIQRCISSMKFSHGKVRWQDSVLIHRGYVGETKKFTVWVAKVLAFVRIQSAEGHFASTENQDVAVIRYYNISDPTSFSKIDRALGCVKLTWATSGRSDDPWVDVIPVKSIVARVHVVPDGMNYITEVESIMYEKTLDTWRERNFYINRFRMSNYEECYMVQDAQAFVKEMERAKAFADEVEDIGENGTS